tara:strand:- start:1647 stop:2423 length:777 start_codon:yes stop_codon:yes gene_type:complete
MNLKTKIGILGCGIVGGANKKVFKKFGFDVRVHDIKLKTKISDMDQRDVVIVCLPTPTLENGDCDTSRITQYLKYFDAIRFKGIIVIRSTVLPGFTVKSQQKFRNLKICFSPEFLRDKFAYTDLINSNFLPIGTKDDTVFKKIRGIHNPFVKKIIKVHPTEAEIIKYTNNLIACNKIVFANIISKVAKKNKCDYKNIKNSLVDLGRFSDNYLEVDKKHKGFAGKCLPKDIKSFIKYCDVQGIDFQLFKAIIDDNKKFI